MTHYTTGVYLQNIVLICPQAFSGRKFQWKKKFPYHSILWEPKETIKLYIFLKKEEIEV